MRCTAISINRNKHLASYLALNSAFSLSLIALTTVFYPLSSAWAFGGTGTGTGVTPTQVEVSIFEVTTPQNLDDAQNQFNSTGESREAADYFKTKTLPGHAESDRNNELNLAQ